MALFQPGYFTLASGQPSLWKLEADTLTDDDWGVLAHLAYDRLPPYGEVRGVPRGGLPFAKALRAYSSGPDFPTLIADDVYTTGGSIRKIMREGDLAVVAFARNPTPPDILALWTLASSPNQEQ